MTSHAKEGVPWNPWIRPRSVTEEMYSSRHFLLDKQPKHSFVSFPCFSFSFHFRVSILAFITCLLPFVRTVLTRGNEYSYLKHL